MPVRVDLFLEVSRALGNDDVTTRANGRAQQVTTELFHAGVR
jgi:hypothetical protein